jgi:hypothetical protein
MLFSNRLFMLGLFCIGITAAATAQAGNQLFKGSWTVKAFGNECSVADPSPALSSTIGDHLPSPYSNLMGCWCLTYVGREGGGRRRIQFHRFPLFYHQ